MTQNEDFKTTLLNALEARMHIEENNEVFDRMEAVQRLLQKWDGQPPAPATVDLTTWGVYPLIPVDEPTQKPALSDAEFAQLKLRLKAAITTALNDDLSDYEPLSQIPTNLRQWDLQGRVGPLPGADLLATAGIWPPKDGLVAVPENGAAGSQASALPSSAAQVEPAQLPLVQDLLETISSAQPEPQPSAPEQADTSDQAPTLALEAYEKGGDSLPALDQALAGPANELPIVSAMPADESSPQPSAPDPDEELQASFDAARALADEEHKYFEARRLLQELVSRARGTLKQPINTLFDQVSHSLQEETQKAIESAQNTQDLFPDDFDRQLQTWNEVRRINPDEAAAQAAVEEIERRQERRKIELDLESLLEQAKLAASRDDIVKLEKLFGETQVWDKRREEERFPDDLTGRVEKTIWEVMRARDRVRDKLGVAATLKVEGQTKAAYTKAYEYADAGVLNIVDPNGVMGRGVDAVIPAQEFFRWVTKEYITSLRQLVSRRIDQADVEMKTEPELARGTLAQAHDYIENSGLLVEHRAQFGDLEQIIEDKLKLVDIKINSFNKAKEKVLEAQALGMSKPVSRHRLLLEAQTFYPDYSDIDRKISQALNDLVAETAGKLAEARVKAWQYAERYKYAEAVSVIKSAKAEAKDVFADVADSSYPQLKLAWDQLEARAEDIDSADRDYQEVKKQVDQANQRLDDYDQYKDTESARSLNNLTEARSIYESLKKRPGTYPMMDDLHTRLASRLDDPQNWEDGKMEYNARRWKAAFQALVKIKSSYAEYQNAVSMAHRAQAAQDIEDGAEYEKKRNWGDAIRLYRQGIIEFDGDVQKNISGCGTDALTEPVAIRAREALLRLREIEDNDNEIRDKIDRAAANLSTAQQIFQNRQGPVDKTDPIPVFREIVDILASAAQKTSTLAAEAQSRLAATRQSWREAYLAGIIAVLELQAPDKQLVSKALCLADDLRNAGLLYEVHEKLADLRVQVLALDLEFQGWFPGGMGQLGQFNLNTSVNLDWNAVELNRQKSLNLTKQLAILAHHIEGGAGMASQPAWISTLVSSLQQESSEKIENELRTISRSRVSAEVTQRLSRVDPKLRRKDQLLEAQKYLQEQVEGSRLLSSDPLLIQQLIVLYWQTLDWNAAEATSERFLDQSRIVDGTVRAEIWRLLTQAAQAFATDRIDRAKSYYEQLQRSDDYKDKPEYSDLIDDRYQDLRKSALGRLLKEAQDLTREWESGETSKNKNDQTEVFLEAAKKYALAYQIDEEHPVVISGLAELGERLGSSIDDLCTNAQTLKPARSQFEETIEKGDAIYETLSAIRSVADLLNVEPAGVNRLRNSLDMLKERLERWKRVKTLMERLEEVAGKAMAEPKRLSNEDDTDGGWSMQPTRQVLNEMMIAAGQDNELRQMVVERRERVNKLDDAAQRLSDVVRALMRMVYAEEFEEVISSSKTLETLWQTECSLDSRWSGLDTLVKETYAPYFLREAISPRDHRDMAAKQRDNLQQWKQWASGIEAAYTDVCQRVDLLTAKELDEMVQDNSIKEIIEMCANVLKAGERFVSARDRKPKDEPKSNKAQLERDRLLSSMVEEVSNKVSQAQDIQNAAKQRLDDFARSGGPLGRLRKIVGQIKALENNHPRFGKVRPIPETNLRLLEGIIQECDQLDPLHEDVIRARDYLKKIRDTQAI